MSRLFMDCGLCGRKQAEGLLSRGHWGHLHLESGHVLRACPTCKQTHADWDHRLLAVVGSRDLGLSDPPRFGGVYR